MSTPSRSEQIRALLRKAVADIDLVLVWANAGRDLLADAAAPGDEGTGAVRILVWREGSRILGPDGAGYGDAVPDQDIALRAQSDLAEGRYGRAAFAAAVLDLRARERGEGRP